MAPPRNKNNLFPDNWVVGPAAAELARNDVGVLLADDPRAAELARAADDAVRQADAVEDDLAADATVDRAPEAPAGRRAGDYPADEIAELKRENERLQRLIAASRGRFDERASRGPRSPADPADLAFGPADPDYGDVRAGAATRRPSRGRFGRILAVATLLIVVFGAGAAWVAGGRLAGPDSTPVQRLEAVGMQLKTIDTEQIRQLTASEIEGLRQRFSDVRNRALAGLGQPEALPAEDSPAAAAGDPAGR